MKHLSVDIETYSDVDIGKSGLYKYCDTDVFEILLFAYAYDFGKVQVIDLASGQTIPAQVLMDLQNPAVIKHAYNAAFEIYNVFNRLRLFGISQSVAVHDAARAIFRIPGRAGKIGRGARPS